MIRWTYKLIGFALLLVGGSFAVRYWMDQSAARVELAKAQEENRVLTRIVERLGDEKRVAEVLVTDQQVVDGITKTSLLFVEYDRAGNALPGRKFQIEGNVAHIDAMVIKFDRDFVKSGDPLRGHSIALFTRIFGEHQTPADGFSIDPPGAPPQVCRDKTDQAISPFEQDLWQQFWKLADDPKMRADKGVRVANGQDVWGPFNKDKLYTITLESDGGLNIAAEPLRGIYREALKDHPIDVESSAR